MKKEKLYHKTVDILVQAYLEDALQHGNYCACAVGNIIANNLDYKFKKSDREDEIEWNISESLSGQHWLKLAYPSFCCTDFNEPIANYQINSTGYDLEEIINIERAFENADEGESEDEYMFNGLMAVIDVLDKIHKNVSSEISQTSKLKFKKQSII